ncbi:hypothetical protein [Pseudonocardia sp. Ae168_Ps1]|uniref:hypothetical protein n=1 Tax=Pseudonocardia sp. Ae168_Ps1 TaxID=1885029 RepID=UPI00094B1913|nr:hypothetical protein [Pseudonocardia sp. Ae168_Ps1]
MTVHLSGVRETIAAFNQMPKDASHELRTRSKRIAERLEGRIAMAARASSSQSAKVAPTVKARRDRVPVVVAGGARRVFATSRPRQKPRAAGLVLFGANFGATYLKQFRPHRAGGGADYWFFSTVDAYSSRMDREWNDAVDEITRRWAAGGGSTRAFTAYGRAA